MSDLLASAARAFDGATAAYAPEAPPPYGRLEELRDGIAFVTGFSHVIVLRTSAGLVAIDASGARTGAQVVAAIREWSEEPVHTVIYTHGHGDHVGGIGAFVADAVARGYDVPQVIGHRNVARRFARYRWTDGYNQVANQRQFGWIPASDIRIGGGASFLGDDVLDPTLVVDDEGLDLVIGDTPLRILHDKGETDDHLWVWLPEHRAICGGDLAKWTFPNCGNPQKVQRYPLEWAHALRRMLALEPELLLPAHGLPLEGTERIARMLDTTASVLEDLVERTVALMNEGAPLNRIIREVTVPDETLALPFLRPAYDEPEFVVRNIWRLYGGWYDGNPARLHPPADDALANEVAALAGGPGVLARRASELADAGDLRMAGQLASWAADAAPEDDDAQRVLADVYTRRAEAATSVMATGIYTSAAAADQGSASGNPSSGTSTSPAR